jgi:hypothetical protein
MVIGGSMLSDVLFVLDDIKAMKICRVWRTHSEDPLIISNLTKIDSKLVKAMVAQFKELGILLPDNKLGEHVEKYIDTYAASRIRDLTGGHV